MTHARLRAGQDEDSPAIIALISACWAEYPGCVMDLDGENPELRHFASHVAGRGGALWVAEAAGRIAGMVAVKPVADGTWEVSRMYVATDQRATGLAQALLEAAEAHAGRAGATRLELWSDTRFLRAHRFYEKSGYARFGAPRALGDASGSIEFGYAKALPAR